MNLFEYESKKQLEKKAPLAARMRPKTLEDFLGQQHIVGEGKLLRRAIIADKITSVIFYGPPGTGKTTLAKIIANTTQSNFVQINATTAGVKDIKETADDAKSTLAMSGNRTILFIDEIHRFNKAQQDALLPHVEDGTVILIGVTTENPFFEVNKALISRSLVFKLLNLETDDIAQLIRRAIADNENGLGHLPIKSTDEAINFLADYSNGDARTALNAIELAAFTTTPNEAGEIIIDLAVAEDCISRRAINYDKTGDSHYDNISAFIKSMRGSDPDAAIYYLAKMIAAGEDPKFIARRIVICASEDVGNADPHALLVAVAAAQATEMIGLPECRINLAQAVCYVACAPKSNAVYCAIDDALADVDKVKTSGVPLHLRNSNFKGEKVLGHGVGYKYPHSYDGNFINQQYLPDELVGKKYYNPTENGTEKKIKDALNKLRPEQAHKHTI